MEIKTFKPEDHKVKAVVYAPSGIGKTCFGATAPKPIFASAEGGLLSTAGKEIPFVQISSLKDLAELLQFLIKGGHGYETAVLDSISEINEIIKQEIEKKNGRAIQRDDWAEVQKKIKLILRGFRNLPMHVLFIAQEKNIMNEDKIHKIVPELNGKVATEMAYYMDIVGYMTIDGMGERSILTKSNKLYLTKDRSGVIGDDTEVDFSAWVEKISKIETGEQKVVASHKFEVKAPAGKDADEKALPPAPPAKAAEEPEKPAPKPVAAPAPAPKKEEEAPYNRGMTPIVIEESEGAPAKSVEEEAVPMMRADTRQKFFACWNEFWSYLCEFKGDALDANSKLKFTKARSETTRKMTMKREFGIESSTQMNQVQAEQLIGKMQTKIKKMKDVYGELPAKGEKKETVIEMVKGKLFRQRSFRIPDLKVAEDAGAPDTLFVSWKGEATVAEVEKWLETNLRELSFVCSRFEDEVIEESLI